MSAAEVTPYRSRQQVGRDGFGQLLRAELTKLRTVRSWMITLGAAALLMVLFALVGSNVHTNACTVVSGGAPSCISGIPPAVVGPGGEAVVDTYSFLRQPLIGTGDLTTEVTSLSEAIASGNGPGLQSTMQPGAVPWAKAGILIEEGTAQGTAYAAVMVTPDHGVRMQYDYIHDIAGIPGTVSASSPRWLRLTRAGDLITGYDSLDGTHWTKIGTIHLAGLPERVEVGLFVTSPAGDAGTGPPTLATATFDRIRRTGDFPDSTWHSRVVKQHLSANAPTYNTAPTDPGWFRQSGGRFAISGSGDIAPQVAGGPLLGLGDTISLLASGTLGLIAVIVLATLFITSEYRRGLIRTSLVASPRRGRVLAAKAVVIGSVTFVVASIATAVAETVSRHVLAANGNYVFPLSAPTEIRVVLGTGLVFALAAIGVMSLGTILRRSAGAVVTGIVAFAVPFVLFHSLAAGDWLFRVTPAAGFAVQGTLPSYAQVANAYNMQNGYYPLGPWVGLAVLGGYAALAFVVAMLAIRRRDV